MKTIEKYFWLIIALAALPLLLPLTPAMLLFRFGRPRRGVRIGLAVSNRWPYRLQYARLPYDLAVWRSGAKVVTITPADIRHLDAKLDRIDALIITGGEDVAPNLYNPQAQDQPVANAARDEMELACLHEARKRNLPLLCICRGTQLLAVSRGGKLIDHDNDLELLKRHLMHPLSCGKHHISINTGSRLESIIGKNSLKVNSIHHQSVESCGSLTVSAVSAEDDSIEALEIPGDRFVLAVQWHPELHAPFSRDHQKLFDALTQAASLYRSDTSTS